MDGLDERHDICFSDSFSKRSQFINYRFQLGVAQILISVLTRNVSIQSLGRSFWTKRLIPDLYCVLRRDSSRNRVTAVAADTPLNFGLRARISLFKWCGWCCCESAGYRSTRCCSKKWRMSYILLTAKVITILLVLLLLVWTLKPSLVHEWMTFKFVRLQN